jgi:hypothetical protein
MSSFFLQERSYSSSNLMKIRRDRKSSLLSLGLSYRCFPVVSLFNCELPPSCICSVSQFAAESIQSTRVYVPSSVLGPTTPLPVSENKIQVVFPAGKILFVQQPHGETKRPRRKSSLRSFGPSSRCFPLKFLVSQFRHEHPCSVGSTEYTEYQSVCPFVVIGSHHLLTRK